MSERAPKPLALALTPDANHAGQMYPDQSLYSANWAPHVVKRIDQAFVAVDKAARVRMTRKSNRGA